MSSTVSQVRQNFHSDTEAAINQQINLELYASYVYLSLSTYFDRDDVALNGFSKFFKHQSDEEREHAIKFTKYQNMRGGRVNLKDVQKPPNDEWGSPLEAVQSALDLEKKVNTALLELHAVAAGHGDAQFTDFLESEFLKEQVESIKQLADYVTNLKRVGPGLGEYMFDRETLDKE